MITNFFFSSSEVEQMAVNHLVVGSNPTWKEKMGFWNKLLCLEVTGLEPITSCLQSMHSTN